MHRLAPEDVAFAKDFETGVISPADFDHHAHLRLAYMFLATHGPSRAPLAFRKALLAYLTHHRIDSSKYHETLTQAWLQAVWLFMQRAGDTPSSVAFLARSETLQASQVMLTHYSRALLFSDEARRSFVPPDLDPIQRGSDGD